ncbi:Drug/Metabolite Transporter (DMT) Superfamily [Trachipleistophora hominis]|uniref:Drug/Metabolite Transporter (DMT) Superfamily n=1 Tax=Trachipleistophora hominis TaxID=72359 RepID=L7JYX5_TRAHO|nr:Drug/Metabolite Transporter (DMT) Superfamily [Trachipleistophora hominis]
MHKIKFLRNLLMSAVIVAAGILKNRLYYNEFPVTLPSMIASWGALLVSYFMAQEHKLPDRLLSLVVVILVLYSLVARYCSKHMDCLVIALCAPSKVIFTCILAKLFFELQLSRWQIFGLSLIIVGIVLPNIIIADSDFSSISPQKIGVCIFAGLLFSLLNLTYEFHQRKKKPFFWNLVFTGSIIGVVVSTGILATEMIKSDSTFKLLAQRKTTYILLVAEYVELSLKAFLLYVTSPIYRSIILIFLSIFTGMIDTVIFGWETIRIVDILAFITANMGLIIFDYSELKKMFIAKEKQKLDEDDIEKRQIECV